jgi:phospholipid/cholesterol/gamma-HCH transport system substrate-binding protein
MAQSKTRWAQLRVGIMAIAALVILSALIFLMAGSQGLFKTRTELYTYLSDSAALSAGSPVRLNGILVGKVSKVELSGIPNEPTKTVRVVLDVDSDYLPAIPSDSKALIAAENLLGTKFINIKKGKKADTVKPGATIDSGETPELDDLFAQGASTIAALQITLKRVDDLIAGVLAGNGTIGKLLVDEQLYNKVMGIADEGQKLVVTLNSDKSTMGKILHDDKLYEDFRGTMAKVNTLLDGLEKGEGTAGKFLRDPALHDDLRKTIADVRALVAQINSEQGDVGKLLHSDELHQQLKTTTAKLDELLDKVNSGQGTLGQLLVNPALYESLDGTTREMQGLLKDFRSNPKKFLRIKLGLF